MKEQRGFNTSTQTVPRHTEHQSGHAIGYHAGLHPDDTPHQTDDYPIRHTQGKMLPDEWRDPPSRRSSAIQRATPKSIIQVTTHEEAPIQRASKLQPYTQPVRDNPPVIQRQASKHWLFYIGIGLCMMLLGGILVNLVVHWAQITGMIGTMADPAPFNVMLMSGMAESVISRWKTWEGISL